MLLIPSYNQHLPCLKCSAFVNWQKLGILIPFTVFDNSMCIRPVQQYGRLKTATIASENLYVQKLHTYI